MLLIAVIEKIEAEEWEYSWPVVVVGELLKVPVLEYPSWKY